MAQARLYALTGKQPKAALRGQAAVVFETLGTLDVPMLATEITEAVLNTGRLVTRQDPLRVVLYYLIIFKNRGIVAATAQPSVEETVEVVETDEDRAEANIGA